MDLHNLDPAAQREATQGTGEASILSGGSDHPVFAPTLFTVTLEAIGYNIWFQSRQPVDLFRPRGMGRSRGFDRPRLPWVARLLSWAPGEGFEREFVEPVKDLYRDASNTQSRGVYFYFHLETGLYEVHDLVSWKRFDRYTLRVQDGRGERIDRDVVRKLLAEGGQHG